MLSLLKTFSAELENPFQPSLLRFNLRGSLGKKLDRKSCQLEEQALMIWIGREAIEEDFGDLN